MKSARASHDDACPLRHLSVLSHGCPQCDLIATGRRAALEVAIEELELSITGNAVALDVLRYHLSSLR